MAVRQIRTFGDPVLRTPAAEVREVGDDVRALMRDMMHTITDKEGVGGVGLAAPQIGVLKRVIVWHYEDERNVIHAGALANPRLLESRGEVVGEEACLSIPGLVYPVVRAGWVMVEGRDDRGALKRIEAEGWVARILQHEIDHLDGILFIDRLSPEDRAHALRKLRRQVLGEPAPAS